MWTAARLLLVTTTTIRPWWTSPYLWHISCHQPAFCGVRFICWSGSEWHTASMSSQSSRQCDSSQTENATVLQSEGTQVNTPLNDAGGPKRAAQQDIEVVKVVKVVSESPLKLRLTASRSSPKRRKHSPSVAAGSAADVKQGQGAADVHWIATIERAQQIAISAVERHKGATEKAQEVVSDVRKQQKAVAGNEQLSVVDTTEQQKAATGGERQKMSDSRQKQEMPTTKAQHNVQNGQILNDSEQSSRQRRPSLSAEEMLEKIRVWEPVASNYQYPAGGPGNEFTMVSYNVLSQRLYDSHPDLYSGAAPEQTAWAVRAPRIWQQLVSLGADIACLQEVEEEDIETFWRPRCRQAGFNILYKKRTGAEKWDGCAVLYRESVFALKELATVEYLQPGCRSLDRDNVGIVVRLRGAGGDLVVACTHLLYNPRRHDVKLAQVALLLAEVDRVAWCGRRQIHLPVLMAGDFNLEPFSPVYQFLSRGWFEYGGLSRRHLTPFGGGEQLLSPLLPPQLGVSAFCQHAAVLLRRRHRPPESEAERRRAERRLLALQHSEQRAPPPPLPLRELAQEAAACFLGHGFRLSSVYRHGGQRGAEVTTCQGRWVTVDYIFQSVAPPAGSARLELISRLALPTAAVCQRLQPYPSAALPSDHLPLAARFRLVPSAASWPGHRS